MSDLKPCPFCGGEARIGKIYGDAWTVECTECGIQSGCYDTESEAIEAWDHRAERKKGKWIPDGKQMIINLENAREQYKELGYPHRNILRLQCSECRKLTLVDESIRYDYCPNCGARLEWSE